MSDYLYGLDAIQKEEIKQLRAQVAKLQATIESVRRRVRWKPPTHGMHTNGPCYVFHGRYQRIIEEILAGQLFDDGEEQ